MAESDMTTVGRMAYAHFLDNPEVAVPAKIDTGADISSIWASHIHVTDSGTLQFQLFDEASPLYTGKVISHRNFNAIMVRSSSGHEQIRYSVKMSVRIESRRALATFTLSDRSKNNFPVLIGSKLLRGKFIVDVSKNLTVYKKINEDRLKPRVSPYYTRLSRDDPKLFYEQHYLKQNGEKS